MKFAFIPKKEYRIGQVIDVQGRKMRVVSYSHTGKNVIVCTLEGAEKFERVLCIVTDNEPIVEIPAVTTVQRGMRLIGYCE